MKSTEPFLFSFPCRSLRVDSGTGQVGGAKDSTTMGDEKVKDEALKILGLFQVLPRLVVFDLDYTLWPFYCECRSKHEMPSLYPHAKGIMYALKDKGVDIAIASRSPTPDIAKTFLDKLGIQSIFVAQEIFSSRTYKTEHFQRIHGTTKVPFNSMMFFDDEDRNIDTVSKMGVTSILVGNGVNLEALRQGLTMFTQNGSSSDRKSRKWFSLSGRRFWENLGVESVFNGAPVTGQNTYGSSSKT